MYAIVEIAGQQFKVKKDRRYLSIASKQKKEKQLNSIKYFLLKMMVK